jgi:hypothetical protein
MDMATWMKIQVRVAEVLKDAMAAPPPTTRKEAYRLEKYVLVGDREN